MSNPSPWWLTVTITCGCSQIKLTGHLCFTVCHCVRSAWQSMKTTITTETQATTRVTLIKPQREEGIGITSPRLGGYCGREWSRGVEGLPRETACMPVNATLLAKTKGVPCHEEGPPNINYH